MTLDQFVTQETGQVVKSAHGLGGECVDLVELYISEVLGDQAPWGFPGNAVNFFGERADAYKWVRNNPADLTQVPPRGAVMVWGESAAVGTGPFGHVDVVLDATGTYFNGFDQNWPLHAPCHVVRHSYVGVIGWGYPIHWDDKPIAIVPQTPTPPAPAPLPPPVNATPGPAPLPAPEPLPAPQPAPEPAPPAPVAPEPAPVEPQGPTTPAAADQGESIGEEITEVASDVAHEVSPSIPQVDATESLPEELGELARDVLDIITGHKPGQEAK